MIHDWMLSRRHEEHTVIRHRIRLALVHMAILAVIWAVLAGFVYSMEQNITRSQVDHQLNQAALHVSLLIGGRPGVALSSKPTDLHALEWSADHHVIAGFQPFRSQALAELRQALVAHHHVRPTYYSMTVMGIPYRVRQWALGPRQIQLFDDFQDDQSRLARLLSLLVWGGAIGLVLSLVGGFLMGMWTFEPILQARRREREFLSDVAHELRTPLAAIGAQVELLIRRPDDPIGSHLPWIETVYSETQRMTRLVNDLLEVGRLEEGKAALSLDAVSLASLCDSVDSIYRPVLEERGLTLTLSIPVDATVMADASRLRQLLLIFLDNAQKHTHQGGVTIAVVIRGGHAELHVKDTGDGMKSRPSRTSSPASGLGLVIAQTIADAHGIALTFDSQPNRGTEVILSFRHVVPRRV